MRNGTGPGAVGKTTRPQPTIIFHGDQDGVVHPANATGFLNHLQRSGPGPLVRRCYRGRSAGGRDFTRTLYRTNSGQVLLEDWTVHGSGHAWSGGTPVGSHTDPAGPNASREMIRFFLARMRAAVRKTTRAETAIGKVRVIRRA
jgi:poly(3-hydroxybutyrate) depolymerase